MQIILLDKVVNLGNLGEIVRVKDGYARNFLIPSGRARRATAAAKEQFELKRVELEKAAAAMAACTVRGVPTPMVSATPTGSTPMAFMRRATSSTRSGATSPS